MTQQSTRKRDLPNLYRLYRQTERAGRRQMLQLIESCPHGRLLDCGCGDGEFTVRVANCARVAEAYGIERVDERIAEASDRGVIVTKADLNDPLPYRDHFFDIIYVNQIIERLFNIDLFLSEVKRVLRGDGYVVLSTHNLGSQHNIFSIALSVQPTPIRIKSEVIVGNVFDPLQSTSHPCQDDSHEHIFSYQSLHELCVHHGFHVETMRTVGYYPLPSSLARLMPQIDSIPGAFLVAKLRPQ